MVNRLGLNTPTPQQVALEYGVYGAREPPHHLKGTILPVQPEWIDELVHKALAKLTPAARRFMSLQRSGFGDRQAKLLLDLLSDPAKTCPREINLNYNQLTDTGVQHLIELLERRPELVEVELFHVQDGRAKGAPRVSAALVSRLQAANAANAAADRERRDREQRDLDARVSKELAETPFWRWAGVSPANAACHRRRTASSHPAMPELKRQLKALGKPVGGKAAELIERLRAALAACGKPYAEPYALSKKGEAHNDWERLQATRPGDWRDCACDEFEAAIASELTLTLTLTLTLILTLTLTLTGWSSPTTRLIAEASLRA